MKKIKKKKKKKTRAAERLFLKLKVSTENTAGTSKVLLYRTQWIVERKRFEKPMLSPYIDRTIKRLEMLKFCPKNIERKEDDIENRKWCVKGPSNQEINIVQIRHFLRHALVCKTVHRTNPFLFRSSHSTTINTSERVWTRQAIKHWRRVVWGGGCSWCSLFSFPLLVISCS